MSSAQEELVVAEASANVSEVGTGSAGGKKEGVSAKKETFQWSTPADEFAEDVESDNEDDHDYVASDMDEVASRSLMPLAGKAQLWSFTKILIFWCRLYDLVHASFKMILLSKAIRWNVTFLGYIWANIFKSTYDRN